MQRQKDLANAIPEPMTLLVAGQVKHARPFLKCRSARWTYAVAQHSLIRDPSRTGLQPKICQRIAQSPFLTGSPSPGQQDIMSLLQHYNQKSP